MGADALALVSGEVTNEDVLDAIFRVPYRKVEELY